MRVGGAGREVRQDKESIRFNARFGRWSEYAGQLQNDERENDGNTLGQGTTNGKTYSRVRTTYHLAGANVERVRSYVKTLRWIIGYPEITRELGIDARDERTAARYSNEQTEAEPRYLLFATVGVRRLGVIEVLGRIEDEDTVQIGSEINDGRKSTPSSNGIFAFAPLGAAVLLFASSVKPRRAATLQRRWDDWMSRGAMRCVNRSGMDAEEKEDKSPS
ncbi:hypothetical protein FB451DRAFT_1183566 [Mycena latifolia]|nr:hypothetical protein FB451DRAFT_1183566 [Mycena latifolia]